MKKANKQLTKILGNDYQLEELTIPKNIYVLSEGKFYRVSSPSNAKPIEYLYVGKVKTCRSGGCSNVSGYSTEINSEFFNYFILYDNRYVIQLVSIFDYQASHGYEMTSTSWLKQFKGYDGTKELIYGRDIDAIAGATISGNATIADVEHKTKLLKKLIFN